MTSEAVLSITIDLSGAEKEAANCKAKMRNKHYVVHMICLMDHGSEDGQTCPPSASGLGLCSEPSAKLTENLY